MTDTTYILAVDPGNEKTGVAIVTPSGTMVCRKIIMTKQFNGEIERILTEYYGVVNIYIHLSNKLDEITELLLV